MKLRHAPTQSATSPLANIQVETIDHLGLVAAAIESLNLVKRINKRLPMAEDKEDAIKVTHGQRVKAMIINGLGYTTSPLYMTPQFFENYRHRQGRHVALADNFLWVADSALYNQGKLQASKIKWLTRIPQTKDHAKALVDLPDEAIAWNALENGYKAATLFDVESGEMWAFIYSEQAYTAAEKSLKQLCKGPFDCEKDAKKAAQKWLKTQHFHHCEFTVDRHERYNQRGKPPQDAEPDRIEYKLSGVITDDLKAQRERRNRLRRFILGTNDIDNVALTAQGMLSTYVEQQGVEKGFRFVKSDEFHLDGVYLKLSTRIDALMMVMTLTLMVYNSTEYQMRETMAELDVSLPNQKKKATKTPTLRWVFQMMQGIHTLKMNGVQDCVSGMDKNKETIVRLFGTTACAIYGVSK